MNRTSIVSIVSAGTLAAVVGFSAPATAAPSETVGAQGTIRSLQDQGYTVVVHNPGGVPLGQASVVAVRTGPEMVDRIRDREGNWDSTVTQSIVFVDVA